MVVIFMFCMSVILASYILCGWGRPNGHLPWILEIWWVMRIFNWS